MAARDERRDPHRTVDLLWGDASAPARGPRPALSLDQIIWAGVEVADAEGLTAVSMRRVAEKLGFTTMSLYRYVPSKGDLLDLMADAVVGPPPADVVACDDWRHALVHWARNTMLMYRERPWVLEVPLNGPPMGPNHLRWMEAGLSAMTDSGMDPGDMIGALMLLSGYVRGHAQLTSSLSQVESRTGVSVGQWDAAYARTLERAVTDGQHPALAKVVQAGVFDEPDAPEWLGYDFEFGLARIIDGIEVHVRGRAPVAGQSDELSATLE
ncbi:TetR family transcriptional regulator [Haloactinopolyspora alba]|uniref:TetR family transcriptional regulator n=1 Tax=Haloactinopolyspora alba TaxID=648780 RepID=A0A2P8DXY3_9ACTN|nr:TetR/AcrR family transcriptional regulator [Haloactinopolyspora alba]PSL02079.1 TetR family transcriptional regulator [Haloactinopolyspora alba]